MAASRRNARPGQGGAHPRALDFSNGAAKPADSQAGAGRADPFAGPGGVTPGPVPFRVHHLAAAGRSRMVGADVPDNMDPRARSAIMAAASLKACFPCSATCKPVSVGMWHPAPAGAALFYPLCRTCHAEATDPRTARLFADAIERRFAKLGEARL